MKKREQPAVPCRLYVLLARDAPVGVVFRRGPSEWVQVIRWNTADDTFEPGHWFKGDIYARRSDLTPDGSKMVYFASKQAGARSFPTWTALSRPPYLTALALWPYHGTRGGGGLFVDDNTLLVNHYHYREALPTIPLPPELNVEIIGTLNLKSDFVRRQRMERDRWELVQELGPWIASENGYGRPTQPEIRRRWSDDRQFCLYYNKGFRRGKTVDGKFEWEEYNLWVRRTETEYPLSGAVWADWDQQERLVFARDGKLFALSLTPDQHGAFPEIELADFNANRIRLFPAPEWATKW